MDGSYKNVTTIVVSSAVSGYVRFHEHLAKLLQFLWTADFFCEEWKLDNVEEFVVELVSLCKVFLLHVLSDAAVFAIRCWGGDAQTGEGGWRRELTSLWEEQLVDDDVVRVNLKLCEFLDKPLGLVQREKFGDAHADERRSFLSDNVSKTNAWRGEGKRTHRVLELLVDLGDDGAHRLEFGKHVLLRADVGSHHRGHLRYAHISTRIHKRTPRRDALG